MKGLYDEKYDGYFSAGRKDILGLLPDNCGRLLEVGCGGGQTIELIKKNRECSWCGGVELMAEQADKAQYVCDEVWNLNIENMNLPLEEKSLDVILCLDVLEHLVDPWSTVEYLESLLVPGGILIISIPNVRHIQVLAPLLLVGRWNYADRGILDKTHLRFFTRFSACAMLSDAGFSISDVACTMGNLSRTLNILSLTLFRRFFEVQYLIKGVKMGGE